MAEDIEEIIIIEEEDDEVVENQNDSKKSLDPEKKKKLILFSVIGFLVLVIIIGTIVLIFSSKKNDEVVSMDMIDEKLDVNREKPIEPSRLEKMISKANYLYSNSQKEEALHLYEKIAQYSEAVSYYNLGVAQLKEKQYQTALDTFKKAIKNDEKRCVSALNAAVCSLKLKDDESFKYYLDLAYAYLPYEKESPLYSYYHTLINYYKQNYYEALSSLENSTSDDYPHIQKHIKAKIDVLYGNNYDAIESIEKKFLETDVFSLGLLYARVGDITLAKQHLEDSILRNIEPAKAELALGFVNLKAGFVSDGAKNIKNVTDMFPNEVYKYYPINVVLKDSLFDSKLAQNNFRNKIEDSTSITYQKIFYFAPYKVFNANQTISYIRKGNANIYIDDISSAKEYLTKGAYSSNVNLGITNAIKKALSFKIREANSELIKLLKVQPKHSILHYNLALTYAQLGDMVNANKHFLRSYHLDAKNYLSGIFAIMSAKIIDKDSRKLKDIIKYALGNEDDSEELELYRALMNLTDKDALSSVDWLDNNYKKRPLYLALEIAIAKQLGKYEHANKVAKELVNILPNEILPHLMYIDTGFYKLKETQYSKEVRAYLAKQKFHFQDLYYGSYITRYLYVQENLIMGRLYFLREQLKKVLYTTKGDKRELIATLALASLYSGDSEESYTLYNQLIDEYKVRDAYTLFLGATASISAKHTANAIVLLELSKRKNKDFLESRYALGLLYLQVQNNAGAVVQLSKVGNNFQSEYFNFNIDTDKLLYEKLHPTPKSE